MNFHPEEVLFSPTADCNLRCGHCAAKKSAKTLSKKRAARFLKGCRTIGIRKVSFTGGEPFLALSFLRGLSEAAVREGMAFGRLMTNAAWPRRAKELKDSLENLKQAGYDGDICASVDAFHRQDLKETASFIRTAVAVWRRPDIVSIARVGGLKEAATEKKLKGLSAILKARLAGFRTRHCYMKGASLFIKVFRIDLSPIGSAARLKDPWNGSWFKDDLCRGPGNVLHVLPDGTVRPCCGYALDSRGRLTIGNIGRDSATDILKSARRNAFVRTVFGSGLGAIRRRLEKMGVRFPGKTSNHCYFCEYILEEIPKDVLERCLD